MTNATLQEQVIATARNDIKVGRKAALRGVIGLAYAFHLTKVQSDNDKAEMDNAATLIRKMLMADGETKGGASTKTKKARQVGENFRSIFGDIVAKAYNSEAERVQACYLAAEKAGAKSVDRLVDWAVKGDPNASDKKAADAAAEKAAKDAEKQDALDQKVQNLNATDPMLSFDFIPEAMEITAKVNADLPAEVNVAAQLQTLLNGVNDLGMIEQIAEMVLARRAEIAAKVEQEARAHAA